MHRLLSRGHGAPVQHADRRLLADHQLLAVGERGQPVGAHRAVQALHQRRVRLGLVLLAALQVGRLLSVRWSEVRLEGLGAGRSERYRIRIGSY